MVGLLSAIELNVVNTTVCFENRAACYTMKVTLRQYSFCLTDELLYFEHMLIRVLGFVRQKEPRD